MVCGPLKAPAVRLAGTQLPGTATTVPAVNVPSTLPRKINRGIGDGEIEFASPLKSAETVDKGPFSDRSNGKDVRASASPDSARRSQTWYGYGSTQAASRLIPLITGINGSRHSWACRSTVRRAMACCCAMRPSRASIRTGAAMILQFLTTSPMPRLELPHDQLSTARSRRRRVQALQPIAAEYDDIETVGTVVKNKTHQASPSVPGKKSIRRAATRECLRHSSRNAQRQMRLGIIQIHTSQSRLHSV